MLLIALALADDTLPFSGPVPTDGDFFTLPFDVPAGTAEIQVSHADGSDEDILDWGLLAPSVLRGWGGGNTEDIVVNADSASRSYLTGTIEAGEWAVLVGKAKIKTDAPTYDVVVTLRDTVTLAAQTERRPYQEVDLGGGPRWYAGDLHVHSLQSGDASPTHDEIVAYARSRGLDFVELSDHNTTAQLDFIGDTQDRSSDVLLLPGVEITTYSGHANGIGVTTPIPFTMGYDGVDIDVLAGAIDGVLSINHPVLDLGDLCIGCAWENPFPDELGAVEIATGGWEQAGQLFDEDAIALWDSLCAEGAHLAAVGGSDDHSAGTATGPLDSPIGSPTTMIYADSLSPTALLAGIRAERTVVKLQGPDDPMIDLTADGETVTAVVTGGAGSTLRVLTDGSVSADVAVDADPFVFTEVSAGSRVRAELWIDDAPRTVTSNVWLSAAPVPENSCGCTGAAGPSEFTILSSFLLLRRRWRGGPHAIHPNPCRRCTDRGRARSGARQACPDRARS